MKTLVIIPARLASSRFPGKMLALLGEKPVLRHVWERAMQAKSVSSVIIATDHAKIETAAKSWGAEVMMTSVDHESGTNRCAEVAVKLASKNYQWIVNVQGDEPFLNPSHIDLLIKQLIEKQTLSISTLCTRITDEDGVQNPNVVKVIHANSKAQYFSRAAIPFLRDQTSASDFSDHSYFQHIGIYAFQAKVLVELSRFPTSNWAQMEKLEQLTWLENGFDIGVVEVSEKSIGIDTPEDLQRAQALMENK